MPIHYPGRITIRLTYGAITHGQWCEKHALPHAASVKVYGLSSDGGVTDLGEASWCDEVELGNDE